MLCLRIGSATPDQDGPIRGAGTGCRPSFE